MRSLFAAFLGYNPMEKLLGSQGAAGVNDAQWRTLTGKTFFPHLIADPFMPGLRIALTASLVMCLVAAARRGSGEVSTCTAKARGTTTWGRPVPGNGSRHDRRRRPPPLPPARP